MTEIHDRAAAEAADADVTRDVTHDITRDVTAGGPLRLAWVRCERERAQ